MELKKQYCAPKARTAPLSWEYAFLVGSDPGNGITGVEDADPADGLW